MVRIAIVDDEAKERENIREHLSFVSQETGETFFITEYDSADSFLFHYSHEVDLIFMDINFSQGVDGLGAAKKLRQIDQTVLLIFITNLAQMAIHGYEVDALDFIVKPLDKYAFLLKTRRALGRVVRNAMDSIQIVQKGEIFSLYVHLIQYLEVDGHYIHYHTKDGVYTEYGTMAAAQKKLGDPCFVHPHRSVLVNLRFITRLGRDCVYLGETKFDIARPQRTLFKEAYLEFLDGQRQKRRE